MKQDHRGRPGVRSRATEFSRNPGHGPRRDSRAEFVSVRVTLLIGRISVRAGTSPLAAAPGTRPTAARTNPNARRLIRAP
jgi:hypothetical protein